MYIVSQVGGLERGRGLTMYIVSQVVGLEWGGV